MRRLAIFLVLATACGKESATSQRTPRTATVAGASSMRFAAKDLTEPAPDATYVVRLEREACYGTCPVYTVDITADGTVRFHGERYVRERGVRTSTIARGEVEALVRKFEDAKFSRVTWEPSIGVTDMPSADLAFVRNGRKRSIHDYQGDTGVPDVVRKLEDEVDRVARTEAWIKCPPRRDSFGVHDDCDD